MLPVANRLRTGTEFAQTTKTGVRATSASLVLYVLTKPELPVGPKVGLIINKSIGGSVVRHRLARQIRHLVQNELDAFPKNSFLVIRVLRPSDSLRDELPELVKKVVQRSAERV
ncbi:MAG: ribonuclease P protein component [Actinomycetes bacterium]